ncbi:MAG: GreA/GreB family elongation factor [Betaproteobacteria bacterium]|nr:GreA/GreB family elongation factor [Betaproteobacteria bacterium]
MRGGLHIGRTLIRMNGLNLERDALPALLVEQGGALKDGLVDCRVIEYPGKIMSRAFVKESDEDSASAELPERPLSAAPNYVTAGGLEALRARLKELQAERERLTVAAEPMAMQRLREIKRDIRYFNAQIDRATVVDAAGQPHDQVHFGATVTIRDEQGKDHRFHIVGDDEANVAAGSISWASPLATALLGTRVGDMVKWQRPAGASEVEIVAINYPVAPARKRS